MADILGGQRGPVTGRERGHAPDIDGVHWAERRVAIEHKYGQRVLSSRLHTAILQARAACRGDTDIPIVSIEETGLTRGSNLRMLLVDAGQLADVIDWYERRIEQLAALMRDAPRSSCSHCGGRVLIEDASCVACGRRA